jgi:hypothetical protein
MTGRGIRWAVVSGMALVGLWAGGAVPPRPRDAVQSRPYRESPASAGDQTAASNTSSLGMFGSGPVILRDERLTQPPRTHRHVRWGHTRDSGASDRMVARPGSRWHTGLRLFKRLVHRTTMGGADASGDAVCREERAIPGGRKHTHKTGWCPRRGPYAQPRHRVRTPSDALHRSPSQTRSAGDVAHR